MLVGWLLLAGCLRDVPRGPDLGACAVLPDGVYGYGDAGIGTCLAGPADLQFFQQDGGSFLAVTNADPYREFRGGSVVIVDWDDLEQRFLDADDRPMRVTMDQLKTHSVEIIDDDDGDGVGSNPFLGGFGYLPEHQAAVVASRYSETGVLRTGKDELFVLDLSTMELPGGDVKVVDTLTLEDDPEPVVVDPAAQRVYVGNLSDHSVSVLTSASPPPPQDPFVVAEVDVAPGPTTSLAPFVDQDNSGSLAEVSSLVVTDPAAVTEDDWTLTFVEQTADLWIPTENEDVDAVRRWSTGDTRTYLPSPLPAEDGLGINGVGYGPMRAPFLALDPNDQPVMYFSRSQDRNVHRALSNPYGASYSDSYATWIIDPNAPDGVVLSDPGQIFGSMSVAILEGGLGMWVDQRKFVDSPASIGLGISLDGLSFEYEGEVFTPPTGESYEDPFVVLDPKTGTYRMWFTIRQEQTAEFAVALSESPDGTNWSEPTVVLQDDVLNYAAPTVAALEGRYGMWLSVSDPTAADRRWDTAFAWSYDGTNWSTPQIVVQGTVPFDETHPPRAGALIDPAGGWRLEGANTISPAVGLFTAGSVALPVGDYLLTVSNGEEVDNNVFTKHRADLGLVPTSAAHLPSGDYLYVSLTGAGSTERIGVLKPAGSRWVAAVDPETLSQQLGVDPGQGVSDPVVVPDADGWVMFYALTRANGTTTIRRSISPDGLVWGRGEAEGVLAGESTWDTVLQRPHSVEALDDGTFRLWYTGSDGSVQRIGSATAATLRDRFDREVGPTADWRLGPGAVGGFDDSAVKDPLFVSIDGEPHLYWAGFDGSGWRIGHGRILADGTIERRTDPGTGLPLATMGGIPRTFSGYGVDSPVLWDQSDDALTIAYAGIDPYARRLGLATVVTAQPDEMFPTQKFPTAGDTLSYSTARGARGAQVVELGQVTKEFAVPAYGMSSMVADPERGFLYVTTKLDDGVFVVDVRDDSNGDFVDGNYLDLEALLQIDSGSAVAGYESAIVSPSRDLMYLTQRNPDGLVIVDLTKIPDDDVKDQIVGAPVAVLFQQSLTDDEGVDTFATIGGDGMALTADERYLLVTHFRGNGLSVYDLDQGPWGEEIAWIPKLGENPWKVQISPDGRYAVVANYLGDVVEDTVSSTLAIIDLDPDSPTYLEAVTWLANH